LAKDEGDVVWKRFVVPVLENQTKKSGTVISYLTSFEKFLTYVTNSRLNKAAPPLYQDYKDTIAAILPEIKGWRSTVDSETQADQNQRWLDESEALLTPEEIGALKSSKPYIEGTKAIQQAKQGKVLSQQEFTLARDLLLVRFATDNATRPGPLNNAKLSDYAKAEISEGNRVMLISKHKRAKDGPAILGMKPDLQEFMEVYVDKIRPQWALQGEDHLFVTVEGKQFPEGTIGRRVSAFFAKAKLRGKRLAHVSVRKFVTTKTKESGTQEEAAIVQRVMSHSAKTAERAYVRTNLTRLGSQALGIIERVTAEKDGSEDQNEGSATTSKSPSVDKGATAASKSSSVDKGATAQQDDDDDDASEPVQSTGKTTASSCTVSLVSEVVLPPTPGRGLTEDQKKAIMRVFQKEITAGTKVSKALVQKRCCTTAVLSILASSINRVKQVVNHVNYIIEKQTKTPPLESEEQTSPSKVSDWLHSYDDPSTRSSGKRQEWDSSDTKAIERAFQKHSSLPSTAEIKKILRQDTKLYSILDKEGWARVYTKVKNIFKKKGKN